MKHTQKLPELETLNSLFSYDPDSGILTWREGAQQYATYLNGKSAGTISKGGYLRSTIKKKMYANHRIAWKMHYGEDPNGVIDHINGIATDNRISNLRDTTQSKNLENRVIHSNSSTGIKGVILNKRGIYKINLFHDGKKLPSPSFRDIDDARNYVMEKRTLLHGEFTCHGHR